MSAMEPEDSAEPVMARLEQCFREIERTRMDGVPILNSALSVKAVGHVSWNEEWLTVLITPWFMNIILVPKGVVGEPNKSASVGTKELVPLPAGRFEFITGFEEAIGTYRMCSLFSPVLEFSDQATAEGAAEAALAALFEAEDPDDKSIDRDMQAIWRGEKPVPQTEQPDGDTAAAAPIEPSVESDPQPEPKVMSRRALFVGRAGRKEAP